jgi:SAM-dependent methyltransferase
MVIDEPLELSAPLARQLASRLCRKNPETGESCEWDHGFWQYLRILGLVATPKRHADFYREAFEQLIDSSSRPRILISGATDYGMLALVLAAFRGRGIEPQVTVVDACETPLALNRWFAERESVEIQTHCSDMLSYTSDVPFDLICTHAFFSYFSPPQRPALLANWHTLLRPGRAVVIVAPIRPGAAKFEPIGPTPAQVKAFCAVALKRATEMRSVLDIEPEEALRGAQRTASKRRGYPITSIEEIRSLFEQAGFTMQRLFSALLTVGVDSEVNGPGTSGTANYAHIIAIRQ